MAPSVACLEDFGQVGAVREQLLGSATPEGVESVPVRVRYVASLQSDFEPQASRAVNIRWEQALARRSVANNPFPQDMDRTQC